MIEESVLPQLRNDGTSGMKGRLLKREWGCSLRVQFICGSNNGSVVSTSMRRWICDSPAMTIRMQQIKKKKSMNNNYAEKKS